MRRTLCDRCRLSILHSVQASLKQPTLVSSKSFEVNSEKDSMIDGHARLPSLLASNRSGYLETAAILLRPAETCMTDSKPVAEHSYQPGTIKEALEFLKRTRSELRMLRKVRIWQDRFQVIDINGDFFEIRGIGYPTAEIIILLDAVNTAFNRETIHEATDHEYKEFKTGRRYTWAADRVM
jgi:hypothetical protein